MGFRWADDGECFICKRHTEKFCDSCGRYVCDTHKLEKPLKGSTKIFIFCKECYSKGKKPVNADVRGFHPEYKGR